MAALALHPSLPVSPQSNERGLVCHIANCFPRMVAQSGSGTSYFNLWLKWAGYSVVDTNILPTAGSALSLVSSFFFGAIADATGYRLATLVVIQLLMILSNVLLSIWYIPKAALLFAFYLSFVGAAAQPIVIVSHIHLGRRGRARLANQSCRHGVTISTGQIRI